MIIQSKLTCRLRIEGEEEMVFTEHEPVVIPARWAVVLLMKFPDEVELVSSVAACPGSEVTWVDSVGQSQTGMVMVKFSYKQESWLLVMTEEQGRFIRETDVIGVNAESVCRLAWEATHDLGTPEAERMAADVVTTLLGIDLNDPHC